VNLRYQPWAVPCGQIHFALALAEFHRAIMCKACMLIKQKPQVNAYGCKERTRSIVLPLGHFVEHQ
jgi:hypothetical protein